MLKPIDLTILVYLRAEHRHEPWTQMQLSRALGVAQSGIHRAIKQLHRSDLMRQDDRAFRDLLVHAVKHVFPGTLGPPARGVPTGHSHPSISTRIHASDGLVWPHDAGVESGTSMTPLHSCVPAVAMEKPRFHQLMAWLDVLRVGRVREVQLAVEELDAFLGLI